jgi:hypothetical protein
VDIRPDIQLHLADHFTILHNYLSAARLCQQVRGQGHIRFIRSHHDHLMTIVRHRSSDGTGLLQPETAYQSHPDPSGSPVSLHQGDLGKVFAHIGMHLTIIDFHRNLQMPRWCLVLDHTDHIGGQALARDAIRFQHKIMRFKRLLYMDGLRDPGRILEGRQINFP